MTDEQGGQPEHPAVPDPSEFENYDEVDSDTVELPNDSFDADAADFESEH